MGIYHMEMEQRLRAQHKSRFVGKRNSQKSGSECQGVARAKGV